MIKKDGQYVQGLWSQRLVYLLRNNELEVHSASFSVIQVRTLIYCTVTIVKSVYYNGED